MEDPSQFRGKVEESSTLELTGKIMVVAIIVLSIVVVFVFLLHLYSKWFWNRRQQGNNNNTTRAANVASILRKGLDPSLLKTLPVISFNPIDFKDGLECAVCLCDVTEGEQTRLLPKCNHGFHVECIDMWFQSHSTCPLCRNPVSKITSESSTVETESVEESSVSPIEVPIFPTNVLFWGNETQVSTLGPCLDESNLQGPTSSQSACPSSSAAAAAAAAAAASTSDRPCVSLVIDIPRQISEEEEYKSPISTRLRSLRRLLSRDRMAYPFSPRVVDVEQGGGRGQS